MINILETRKADNMEKFTKRELEIINLLSEGMTNLEIANKLFISVHTVKASLENIYAKTGIHNRVLLALYMYKLRQESNKL